MRKISSIFLISLCLILISKSSYPQNALAGKSKIDSLLSTLSKTKEDTSKVKLLVTLSKQYRKIGEYDTAMKCAATALRISEKKDFKIGRSESYNAIGEVHRMQGDLEKALENYKTSLAICVAGKDTKGMAFSYNNIGLIFDNKGNYPEALKYFFLSLKLKEKLGDKKNIATAYVNIGNVYYLQSDYRSARIYFLKAHKIYMGSGDKFGVSAIYFNMGNLYMDEHNYTEARGNFMRSMELKKELGDKKGISNLFLNIGNLDFYEKRYEAAIENYLASIKLKKELKIISGVAAAYTDMGRIYTLKKDYLTAKDYLTKGFEIGKQQGNLEDLELSCLSLSEVYEKENKHGKALEFYKRYIIYRDSLFNEENTKKTVQAEMNYEFDKKETAAKLTHEKKDAVASAESRKQKIVIWSVCGILLLVFIFAVFAYRSYLQKQKANIEITKQKHVIEEKQKEILDSIYYARRIQRALLPSEKYIEKNLNG